MILETCRRTLISSLTSHSLKESNPYKIKRSYLSLVVKLILSALQKEAIFIVLVQMDAVNLDNSTMKWNRKEKKASKKLSSLRPIKAVWSPKDTQ
jgi:hypothetical protein